MASGEAPQVSSGKTFAMDELTLTHGHRGKDETFTQDTAKVRSAARPSMTFALSMERRKLGRARAPR